jgi:hypothetical protein
MAISRAQLLKELLPGLNALFGLEYAKYGDEAAEIFETESSDRSFEEETKLSVPRLLRVKVLQSSMTMRKKRGLLVTLTRQSLWASR